MNEILIYTTTAYYPDFGLRPCCRNMLKFRQSRENDLEQWELNDMGNNERQ